MPVKNKARATNSGFEGVLVGFPYREDSTWKVMIYNLSQNDVNDLTLDITFDTVS